MKKILSAFVVLAILTAGIMVSCKKNDPTAPSTPTATPTITPLPDNTTYNFEDGTVMGWTKKLGGVSGVVNSTTVVYLGSRSLQVNGNFTGGASNSAEAAPPVPANLTGMKIIARVYIPANAPDTGGSVYIQSGPSSCWEQGPWISYFTKGGWTQLELDPANPSYVSGSNPDHTNVAVLGINFNPSAAFTGPVYFDSINIVSAGTPTSTRTITPTHSISPTATETITGTPPTETVTPTITQTPTLMSTPIAPNDPNIRYYGRWNHANPLVPKNGWGATYIVAGFEGTGISIKLSAWDAWYGYAIDDFSDHTAFTKFRVSNGKAGTQPTPYVVSGLADTSHTIMVVRRSEGWGGVNDFYGFGLETGKTLVAPAPTAVTRKMEFIGDSITCGSVDEYISAVPTATADLPCDYGGCVQNGDTTYAMQLARLYGAEGRTICRGGIGIYRNCGTGCAPNIPMISVFPNMYFEAAPGAGSLTWNFSSWQADVVMIALGTNDFSQGVPDETAFKTAYSDFLTALRSYYPNAYIFCTQPLPAWVPATAGTFISDVVAAKSDAKIIYIPINNPAIAAGFPLTNAEYADDTTHPLNAAHLKLANALKAWIDTNVPGLGW